MIGSPTATDRDHHEAAVPPRLFGASDVGRVSSQNQDAFGLSEDGQALVLADGMGGLDFGDVASLHAVESVLTFLADEQRRGQAQEGSGHGAALMAAVEFAHERLSAEAAHDPLRRKTGTTLIVARVVGDMLYTCHVGDSRAYVLSQTGLRRITRDHSMVEVLLRSGQITAAQARFHPRKNEITQAVGLSQIIGPTVNEMPIHPGDRLLLCSDGLWGPLPEEEITSRLATESSIAEAGRNLIDGANLYGGRDNITAVVYEHSSEEK
jgi:serine/threonine protein phosphatase PrpC